MDYSLKTNVRRLVATGLLISLNLVFARLLSFFILGNSMRVGFGELPIIIGGMVFGPVVGMLVGGIGDFVGTTFMSPFPWFPPLATAPMLLGLVSGTMWYFLKKDSKVSFIRIFITILTAHIIANMLVGTYWLTILLPDGSFWPLFVPRAIQRVVMAILESCIIYAIYKSSLIKVMKGIRSI